MRQLFLCFKDLEILNARVQNLSWTHYRMLLRVPDEDARYWYLREASQEMWSSRTLSRNIGSQYYYRLLQSPKKDKVIAEMQELTRPLQQDKDEIVKNPVVAEFLGLENTDYSESELEQAIIDHLQKFIMEMGRGFAYMGRQQLIRTDTQDQIVAETPPELKKQLDMSFAIADKLDATLKELGLTQKEFAHMIGHTQAEVSRWLSGTHNFTLATLAKISVALDVNLFTV